MSADPLTRRCAREKHPRVGRNLTFNYINTHDDLTLLHIIPLTIHHHYTLI